MNLYQRNPQVSNKYINTTGFTTEIRGIYLNTSKPNKLYLVKIFYSRRTKNGPMTKSL